MFYKNTLKNLSVQWETLIRPTLTCTESLFSHLIVDRHKINNTMSTGGHDMHGEAVPPHAYAYNIKGRLLL